MNQIAITQESYDYCYEDLYVKHFYSDEDIEKFKEKWKAHIKNKKTKNKL